MRNEVCHWHGVAFYLAKQGRPSGCQIINLRPLIANLTPLINDQGSLIDNLTAAITNPGCLIGNQGMQI